MDFLRIQQLVACNKSSALQEPKNHLFYVIEYAFLLRCTLFIYSDATLSQSNLPRISLYQFKVDGEDVEKSVQHEHYAFYEATIL